MNKYFLDLIIIVIGIISLVSLIIIYIYIKSIKKKTKAQPSTLKPIPKADEPLARNINIGLFRATLDRKGKFVEANPAAVKIFDSIDKNHLFKANITDMFDNPNDRKRFLRELLENGAVINHKLRLKKSNGNNSILLVSAILIKDKKGKTKYCDGYVEDVTVKQQREEEREELIVKLQTALLFLNQTIEKLVKKVPSIEKNITIHEATKIITQSKQNTLLIKDKEEITGAISTNDIIKILATNQNSINNPIEKFITSPPNIVSENTQIFEAILFMLNNNLDYLIVGDGSLQKTGILTTRDLLKTQDYSLTFLTKQIQNATKPKEIFAIYQKLQMAVMSLVSSDLNIISITRVISTVTDQVHIKLLEFAIKKLGPAPVKFSFIVLGSAGRQEQTLKTDQDNGIIFEDVPKEELENVRKYFLKLGETVCGWLNDFGYPYCQGNKMAQNPDWCQPLSVWKKYFSSWINKPEPEALLEIKIFFDFRAVFGENSLATKLRNHIENLIRDKGVFLLLLTQNCLLYKPPIGLFGNILVESGKEHNEMFSIKKAITPIVDFVRIYTIKHHIKETNTLKRIEELYAKNIFAANDYNELRKAYVDLMRLKFRHQAAQFNDNQKFDNYINPKQLTHIEQRLLKEIFSQITNFQAKLSLEFTGQGY